MHGNVSSRKTKWHQKWHRFMAQSRLRRGTLKARKTNGRIALRKTVTALQHIDTEILEVWSRQPLTRKDGIRLGGLQRRREALNERINCILRASLTRQP